MDQPATCGQGVAEYAPLPEKVAALFATMAATLAHHRKALDLSDGAAREEDGDFAKLVDELGELVTRLRSVEARMSGYRNLPMGRHDESIMGGPITLKTFAEYVAREQELVKLLEDQLARDQARLESMR